MSRAAALRAWFTPGLLGLHLLGVVALAVCLVGGFWQLGVYEARQGDAVDDARQVESASITDVWSAGQPFTTDLQNLTVTVDGTFGPADQQLWVDGPGTDGRAWLVAPFQVDGSGASLLVVRGSASSPRSLPAVPEGQQSLEVALQPSTGGGTPLDGDRTTTAVTVASLINELPVRLWSGYGIVTAGVDGPDGLAAVDPPDPDVSWTVGLKNLAYAFQWWVFGAFALFMWWRMATEQVQDRRRSDDPVAV